jgi:hypothetical protein
MKTLERDSLFFQCFNRIGLCLKFLFQANEVAGFDDLNLVIVVIFSEPTIKDVIRFGRLFPCSVE